MAAFARVLDVRFKLVNGYWVAPGRPPIPHAPAPVDLGDPRPWGTGVYGTGTYGR
jgi:hypothetical protein